MNSIDPRAAVEERLRKAGGAVLTRTNDFLKELGTEPARLFESIEKVAAINLSYVITDLTFVDPKPVLMQPDAIQRKTLKNQTAAEIQTTFTYEDKVSRSFTLEFSAGLKLGTQVTLKGQVPVIGAGVSMSVNRELSFGAKMVWETTAQKGTTHEVKVILPAHTAVIAVALLKRGRIECPFTAVTRVGGIVRIDGWLPIHQIHRSAFAEVPIERLLDAPDLMIPLSGTMASDQGYEMSVEVEPMGGASTEGVKVIYPE